MAGTVIDKYIPQEGLNTIFSEVKNSDIVTRPSQKGFQSSMFFFKKRPGLETKKDSLGNSVWKTRGTILGSKEFNGMLYMYTNKGYIYSFDGSDLRPVIADINKVSDYSGSGQLVINSADNIERVGQEFTVGAKNMLLSNIKVNLKKDASGGSDALCTIKITTAADKNTVLYSSETSVSSGTLTSTFETKAFSFPDVLLTAATKYFFYVDTVYTSSSTKVYVQYNPSTIIAGTNVYTAPANPSTTWTNTAGTLYHEVYGTSALTMDLTNYDQDILAVNYISGTRYPNSTTSYTVSAYDSATATLTFTTSPFTTATDRIGKYMYISSGGTAKYQQRGISDVPATNKLTASSSWGVSPVAGDVIEIYTEINAQLWFPQIRKGTSTADAKFMFALDINGQGRWIYMPQRRNLEFWDNRVIQLTKDSQALIPSSNIDYEIPITTTIDFGNAKAVNMISYGGYLIVFFDRKIGLVKKDIIDSGTNTFAYLYQDLLDTGLYSRDSYLVSGGALYIFGNDKKFYALDLSVISLGQIMCKPSDLGEAMINYFNNISGGTVTMQYVDGNINIAHRGDTTTTVFKYNKTYKSWIIDEYAFAGNIFNFLYKIGTRKFTVIDNILYEMSGLLDNGISYTQNIQIYGPVQAMFARSDLLSMVIRLGWDGVSKLGGKCTIEAGGYETVKKTYILSNLSPIQKINQTVLQDGTIGSAQYGEYLMGGDNTNRVLGNLPEIVDIGLKIGLHMSYYKMDIYNDEEAQMFFGGVSSIMNGKNEQFIPNLGVANSI